MFICDYIFSVASLSVATLYTLFFELKSPVKRGDTYLGKKDLCPGSHLLDATQGLPACFQCNCLGT